MLRKTPFLPSVQSTGDLDDFLENPGPILRELWEPLKKPKHFVSAEEEEHRWCKISVKI